MDAVLVSVAEDEYDEQSRALCEKSAAASDDGG
jgi:hypothetical protein